MLGTMDMCRAALQQRDLEALATLMDQNFELRRKIFGDAVIGKANLRMVKLARFFGGRRSALEPFGSTS